MARVGIKYCGGCNPRFDRVAAVESLGCRALPAARPGERYDLILVVCGCSAACAGLDGLEADQFVTLSRLEDLPAVRAELDRVREWETGRR